MENMMCVMGKREIKTVLLFTLVAVLIVWAVSMMGNSRRKRKNFCEGTRILCD